jgi:hypothetical protein
MGADECAITPFGPMNLVRVAPQIVDSQLPVDGRLVVYFEIAVLLDLL